MTNNIFVYDDISLQSVGFIIGGIDSSSSAETVDTDSQRNFNSVTTYLGKYHPFTVATYDDALVMRFSIVKNPCQDEDGEISLSDMVYLKRWLSRPTPHVLRFSDPEYSDVYWEGSFNLSEIHLGGKRVGVELTFTCNRPYGIRDVDEVTGSVDAGGSFVIYDASDDEGYLYPELKITCKQGGTLQLTNSFDGRVTEVKNVENNEVITFSPTLQITSSSDTHKTLMDDFNFEFLRIGNDFRTNKNEITSSISCDYSYVYKPAAKVVIV